MTSPETKSIETKTCYGTFAGRQASRVPKLFFGLCLIALAVAGPAYADNLAYHGGPVMQTVNVYLIFWLPRGHHYATTSPDPNMTPDQFYEARIKNFINSLPQTDYWNILTQYTGVCSRLSCPAPRNAPHAVQVAGAFVDDRTPYPSFRLKDEQIQDEVQRVIDRFHWIVGLNSEFFVFTGANVWDELDDCGYHNSFGFSGTTIYSFMSNADSFSGCHEGLSEPLSQLEADRETVLLSHELFESVTDPISFRGWWEDGTSPQQEIGDKCNQNSAEVTLSNKQFAVQKEWSNDASSCVDHFGPSIEFDITSGDLTPEGLSSASASLQSNGSTFQNITLLSQGQMPAPHFAREVVAGLTSQQLPTTQAPLTDVVISLSSRGNVSDMWLINHLSVKVLNTNGQVVCQTILDGTPAIELTSNGNQSSQTVAISNCPFVGPTPTPTPAPVCAKPTNPPLNSVQSANCGTNEYTAPTINPVDSHQVGTLPNGTIVSIVCQTPGDGRLGFWGWDELWDQLSDGHFVADADVFTNSFTPVAPLCGNPQTAQGTVAATVGDYFAPSVNSPLMATLNPGQVVTILCQVHSGESYTGFYGTSDLWDQVTYLGGYVPDMSINDGHSDQFMPTCPGFEPVTNPPPPVCNKPTNPALDSVQSSSCGTNEYTAPTINPATSTIVGTLSNGTIVSIACETTGDARLGFWGWDELWDQLSDGHFVADTDVFTNSFTPVAPLCGNPPTFPGTVAATVGVFVAPTTDTPRMATLNPGQSLTILCQVHSGISYTGPFGTSDLWDQVTYLGGFVPDASVNTGSSGQVAPTCPGFGQ